VALVIGGAAAVIHRASQTSDQSFSEAIPDAMTPGKALADRVMLRSSPAVQTCRRLGLPAADYLSYR
jgi:hypothetical protein